MSGRPLIQLVPVEDPQHTLTGADPGFEEDFLALVKEKLRGEVFQSREGEFEVTRERSDSSGEMRLAVFFDNQSRVDDLESQLEESLGADIWSTS